MDSICTTFLSFSALPLLPDVVASLAWRTRSAHHLSLPSTTLPSHHVPLDPPRSTTKFRLPPVYFDTPYRLPSYPFLFFASELLPEDLWLPCCPSTTCPGSPAYLVSSSIFSILMSSRFPCHPEALVLQQTHALQRPVSLPLGHFLTCLRSLLSLGLCMALLHRCSIAL